MSPRARRWRDNILYVAATTIIVLVIFLGYAFLSGCSQVDRVGMVQAATETATNAALDRLEAKLGFMNQQYAPPSAPMSEGGMAAVVAAMNGLFAMFYLARKKWFPIEPKKKAAKAA